MSLNIPEIDKFHNHLDVCKQCRDNPFGLCTVGASLLQQAGSAADASLAAIITPQPDTCRCCGREEGDGKFGTCDGYCDTEN